MHCKVPVFCLFWASEALTALAMAIPFGPGQNVKLFFLLRSVKTRKALVSFFLLRRFVRAVLRNANAVSTHVCLHRKGCCLVLLRLD